MPLHPAELSCLQPALLPSSAAPHTAFALFQVKLKLPLHCRCLWSCVQDVAMGSSPALLLTALWSDATPRAGGKLLCTERAQPQFGLCWCLSVQQDCLCLQRPWVLSTIPSTQQSPYHPISS